MRSGEIGWEVWVGGGLGRTPMIASRCALRADEHLLAYLESIMRVYNLYGRRDNKYKARIKILVHEKGIDKIRERGRGRVRRAKGGVLTLPQAELDRIAAYFAAAGFERLKATALERASGRTRPWPLARAQPRRAQAAGLCHRDISLKPVGGIPGRRHRRADGCVADLAERYSFDELRVSHEQNLVLPHVRSRPAGGDLRAGRRTASPTGNAGLITDIIACPGLDFCALANARSIPMAQEISERFAAPSGRTRSAISRSRSRAASTPAATTTSATSASSGVEKKGTELYQITLGGDRDENAAIGDILGPGFVVEDVPDAIETMVDTYLALREPGETFLAAYRRLGAKPFKEALYAMATNRNCVPRETFYQTSCNSCCKSDLTALT
jgi:sulfite reductase (NADPH) hemoprotein beta-component